MMMSSWENGKFWWRKIEKLFNISVKGGIAAAAPAAAPTAGGAAAAAASGAMFTPTVWDPQLRLKWRCSTGALVVTYIMFLWS